MSMDLPAAPKTQGKVIPKIYSEEKIEEEKKEPSGTQFTLDSF